MGEGSFKYVFGPVPSRRLGRSLGVDIVPCKTCTFDCMYCQVGRTTAHVIERAVYVPREAVVDEVRRKLAGGAQPDYVTVSGSGEPTLYLELGELIADLKGIAQAPVAVITNGSLMGQEDVRAALLEADLVVPSLDAGTQALFERVNRPHPAITLDAVVSGLVAFRDAFKGQMWLEVFLLGGLTGTDDEVRALAEHVGRIRPDRVQLNTVARPPADSDAQAVPKTEMERFAGMFDPPAEVIADFTSAHSQPGVSATRAEVLDLIRRRPCTLEGLADGLAMHRHEVAKHITHLIEDERVHVESRDGERFFVADGPGPEQ